MSSCGKTVDIINGLQKSEHTLTQLVRCIVACTKHYWKILFLYKYFTCTLSGKQ